MSSAKPALRRRTALAPQRRPGRERVAALLQAGAAVIAERGFEAATMAEIAARAGAPIGSLYRFFPSKEALADALMDRYQELVKSAFARLAAEATSGPREFADALLNSMDGLRGETKDAVVALIDARPDATERRSELHESYLRNIEGALRARCARLTEREARDMAVVLLQNVKCMKSLDAERDAGAIAELREMTRLYLANKLPN